MGWGRGSGSIEPTIYLAPYSGKRRAEIIPSAGAPQPILTPLPATSCQEDAVVVNKTDRDAGGDGRREECNMVEGGELKDRKLAQLSTDPKSLWDSSEKQLLLFSHHGSQQEIHFRTSGGLGVRTPRFHCRGHGFDPWSGN